VTTDDGLPVLFMAMLFQWTQITVGVYYQGITGRPVLPEPDLDATSIVLTGLVWLMLLAAGIRGGIELIRRRTHPRPVTFEHICGWAPLVALYAAATLLQGTMLRISFEFASLRNVLVTMSAIRLALMFLVLRRLVQPEIRWVPFALILGGEVVLGFAGYFAGFREPIMLATVALLEGVTLQDRRRLVLLGSLGAVAALTGLVWMGIRPTYRLESTEVESMINSQSARLDRVWSLSTQFLSGDRSELLGTADDLVARIWIAYYPALTMERVPSLLSHTDGALMRAAIENVLMPRVFYPDKGELPSDSDMVRKYAGVYVAGRERNTSIAFGALPESYIDYGIPLMFLPPLVFGFLCGLAYAWLYRGFVHRELAVAVVTVVAWESLYLFERSWAKTLGDAVAMVVYVALPLLLLDQALSWRGRPDPVPASYEGPSLAPHSAEHC